jgi:hypothetical protein
MGIRHGLRNTVELEKRTGDRDSPMSLAAHPILKATAALTGGGPYLRRIIATSQGFLVRILISVFVHNPRFSSESSLVSSAVTAHAEHECGRSIIRERKRNILVRFHLKFCRPLSFKTLPSAQRATSSAILIFPSQRSYVPGQSAWSSFSA